jgi:DNA-binding NarL/FixJ family response regulator
VRVALVNDYEVVVRGLAATLRCYTDEVEVVEAEPGGTAVPVDITLYDTFAAPQGDQEGVRRLAQDPSAGKVVVYSWNLEPELVAACLANGASACLPKGLPARRLLDALAAIQRGEPHGDCAGHWAPAPGGDWPGREEGLTPRESEVLALITQGLSNAQIADRALLSINSVKTYIRSCYRRIGVVNRTHAILWAVEHQFLAR